MAKRKTKSPPIEGPGLYELEVALISGLATASFVKANRRIRRTIEIRGDQTLAELHEAIFKAFDRFDEHMYEFQVGGKRMHDKNARRYVLPISLNDDWGTRPAGCVEDTTIASLELKRDEAFGYWFDFGDDWLHQVTVLEIHEQIPAGRYPKITNRIGKSPPQYLDLDDEGEEDDADG